MENQITDFSAIMEFDGENKLTGSVTNFFKRPPPAARVSYFFGDSLNKSIYYYVDKYHIIDVFLFYHKNSYIFSVNDNAEMRHIFHEIRLEALTTVKHYKDWISFSDAIHTIFKRYRVSDYLLM